MRRLILFVCCAALAVRASSDTPPVRATIVAEIYQTMAGQVKEVDVAPLWNGGRAVGPVAQTVKLTEAEDVIRTVRFENLDAGSYLVVAKGSDATQRAAVRVELREGDTQTAILPITPFRLRLQTTVGGESVGLSHVTLRQAASFGEAKIKTDVDGEATVELWQTGAMRARIFARDVLPYEVKRTITEPVDAHWSLDVPRLAVTGMVIDDSGAPVPNASLWLRMKAPGRGEVSTSAKTDADGAFSLAPVTPGEHILRAAARDYPPTTITYTFGKEDQNRGVELVLRRMPSTQLRVLDRRGRPLAATPVLVYDGQTNVYDAMSGTDGQVPVFIPMGQSRDVYVAPPSGSLGVMRIASGTPGATLRLPEAASRIVVRTESLRGELIPATVDVRYDGFLLPDEVMELFYARGSQLHCDGRKPIVLELMPAGMYELLPFTRRGAAAPMSAAPVRLQAKPGENVVTMTFSRAQAD